MRISGHHMTWGVSDRQPVWSMGLDEEGLAVTHNSRPIVKSHHGYYHSEDAFSASHWGNSGDENALRTLVSQIKLASVFHC